jgi:hypothetical protein
MFANCIPHSLLVIFSPSRIPTPLPSYTVWCFIVLSWCHSLALSHPFLYRTAPAPILPSIPDLFVNTLTSGFSHDISAIALSASMMILVFTFIFHLVSCLVALIISMFCSLMLYLYMRSCSGVGCHLTSLLAVFLIGLCSGCVGGSVANHMAAPCQCLLTSSGSSIKFTMTSVMSVAVVFMAPIIMITAHLCSNASLLSMACFVFLSLVFLPTFCWGVRKISVVYSILGTAIDMYSCHRYLACAPLDAHAILSNWINHPCFFAKASVHCLFQLSLLSMVTPKNLAVSLDGMH